MRLVMLVMLVILVMLIAQEEEKAHDSRWDTFTLLGNADSHFVFTSSVKLILQ